MISFKHNFAAKSRFEGFRPPQWRSTAARPPLTVHRPSDRSRRLRRTITLAPWLADVAYGLNQHLLLPTYFDRIAVTGQSHVPLVGPVIFAPTHRSRWDGLLVPYAVGHLLTGRYLRYMVTVDEMQGLQGWLIRRMGGFSVDPRSPGVGSLRHGIELLHQGEPLVVFPEGGKLLENRRAGVNRLHPGLARIAIQAQLTQPHSDVKIVPLAINYRDSRVGRRCAVDIQIGAPLAVSDYHDRSAKGNARRMTQDLAQALQRLSHLPEMARV